MVSCHRFSVVIIVIQYRKTEAGGDCNIIPNRADWEACRFYITIIYKKLLTKQDELWYNIIIKEEEKDVR